eukprot:scaffold167_cov119-Skeletonema_dohrnii-CCMP3373.AAC.4
MSVIQIGFITASLLHLLLFGWRILYNNCNCPPDAISSTPHTSLPPTSRVRGSQHQLLHSCNCPSGHINDTGFDNERTSIHNGTCTEQLRNRQKTKS